MIRSAKSTTRFTDPAMGSLVGVAAERSMALRCVIGTIGVLVATSFAAMIVSGIISAVFDVPFLA
jgi:hypothetical protein